MKEASIYFEKEVLVIDFRDVTYNRSSIVHEFSKTETEVRVNYTKRVYGNISHNPAYDYIYSDVDPYSKEHIERALPEYVEWEFGYYKSLWFGLIKKWIPAKRKLKEGWVEFRSGKPKTVVTTQYRIIT